jgi:hypothetical protein
MTLFPTLGKARCGNIRGRLTPSCKHATVSANANRMAGL